MDMAVKAETTSDVRVFIPYMVSTGNALISIETKSNYGTTGLLSQQIPQVQFI